MTHVSNQTSREPGDLASRCISTVAAVVVAVSVTGPQLATAGRAVVNLPTSAAAVVWGRTHRGRCEIHDDLIVTCGGMQGGYTNAGTTVGNVWLYGTLQSAGRHRHEARHSDQWAVLGAIFPVVYGAEWVRTGGDFHRNLFELAAGLHDGGYLP